MKDMWHVFYSSRGAAGAYVDALLKACHQAGVPARAFVSWRYAYSTAGAIKLFFPLTEAIERRNRAIWLVRGIELWFGYLAILLLAAAFRPAINLHLLGPLSVAYPFFRACKLLGLPVWVTCHDVVPHDGKMTRQRLNVFRQAHRLVVHSEGARRKLAELLDGDAERIRSYPFPFSSYDEILEKDKLDDARTTFRTVIGDPVEKYFVLAGIVRESKGIRVLLDAWDLAQCRTNSKLVIAGKWSGVSQSVKDRARSTEGCVLVDRYVGNEELVYLIANARVCVLPYNEYTHSGILLSIARHGAAVIVSDIDLFVETLPHYQLMFPAGNAEKLAALMDRAAEMSTAEAEVCQRQLREAVAAADQRLVAEIGAAYTELL